MGKTPDLKDAYSLRSPDDVVELYQAWAQTYDAGFGDAQGYQLPKVVARAFVAAGGRGPVLDVGAGTGLVAEHLTSFGDMVIDAVDLSDDMLEVSRQKGLYRGLYTGDVTQPLSNLNQQYYGVISAGTFTHGHVGPEGLDALIDIALPGAIFALSVNQTHFEAHGFTAKFSKLESDIADFRMNDARIYDDRADADHRNDLARIVTFRKL